MIISHNCATQNIHLKCILSTKFGVHFASKNGYMPKIENFANSKWQTAAILKSTFGYISASYCPINAKFGGRKHHHTQTLEHIVHAAPVVLLCRLSAVFDDVECAVRRASLADGVG